MSRGKKRRLTLATPHISVELALEVRTNSAADINAEFSRHVSTIMRVAMTSSNLKGTYIKDLKDATSYITAAWKYENPRRLEAERGVTASRLAEARLSALEEENAALRQELSRRAACAHECPRCSASRSEAGRPSREDKRRGGLMEIERRIEALERQFKELVPSIVRAMEERFGGQQQRTPEPRRRVEHSATRPVVAQTPVLPREQEGDEWRVVENKKRKRKRNRRNSVAPGEEAKKVVTAAPQRGRQARRNQASPPLR
jgi:hypothetical protein